MITVLFRKVIRSSMLSLGINDLRVYRYMDVPIIQPELRVIDGHFWVAHVKTVAVHNGQVLAQCYDDDTVPSYSKGQDWHMALHVNQGWFDTKPEAWNDYVHKKRSVFQQTDPFKPFFVWSYNQHGSDHIVDTATTRTDVTAVERGSELRVDSHPLQYAARPSGAEVRRTWIDEVDGLGPG